MPAAEDPYDLVADLFVSSQEINRLAARAVALGLTVEFNTTASPGLQLLVRFPAPEGCPQSSMRTFEASRPACSNGAG